MQLDREMHTVDLSAEATVLTYTYAGDSAIVVLARADVGISPNNLSGVGGIYSLNFYINGDVLAPESDVAVLPGRLTVVMASRSFPVEPGDEITLTITGLPEDTSVNVVSSLQDVTPAQAIDLVGSGSAIVDQNYGGTDAMTVMTVGGVRVGDVTIEAYRSVDWFAGNRTPEFVVAITTTDVNGYWVAPMQLDPGEYTLNVFKKEVLKNVLVALTVG